MANMLKMMKQAAAMQKKLKKVHVEGISGGVTVSVRGDMTLRNIQIDEAEVDTADIKKLEKMIITAANKGLDAAKKQAATQMQGMTGGLGGLMG